MKQYRRIPFNQFHVNMYDGRDATSEYLLFFASDDLGFKDLFSFLGKASIILEQLEFLVDVLQSVENEFLWKVTMETAVITLCVQPPK